MLRKLVVAVLALVLLGSISSIALAEDASNQREATPADPGIAAMRDAIEALKHDREILRADCAARTKPDACRAKYRELLDNFRAARQEALELHRAFVERGSSDRAKTSEPKAKLRKKNAASSEACLRLKQQLKDGTLPPNVKVRDAWRKACETPANGRPSSPRRSTKNLFVSR